MISVVIPVWIVNEELLKLTENTINSLGEVAELIIIDNGSTLGGGYLRSKADIYVRNKENLGYARAVNQGLKLAKNKLICISNNDVRPSPNWQEVAKENLGNEKVYSLHFRMTDYETPFDYGHTVNIEGKERWCTSSFFVINVEKYKFFYDEEYFNSIEDWDYWYTVRQIANLHTAYTDKASYQHYHSASQKYVIGRDENDKKNREHFVDKWGEEPEKLFEKNYPLQVGLPYNDGFNIQM